VLFLVCRETEEALKVEESAPIAEKQGEQDDAPTGEKDNKEGAANEEEEKEEDKVMIFICSLLCLN
jgi:plasminogen activator inhibitor 1 RNA-binding protein